MLKKLIDRFESFFNDILNYFIFIQLTTFILIVCYLFLPYILAIFYSFAVEELISHYESIYRQDFDPKRVEVLLDTITSSCSDITFTTDVFKIEIFDYLKKTRFPEEHHIPDLFRVFFEGTDKELLSLLDRNFSDPYFEFNFLEPITLAEAHDALVKVISDDIPYWGKMIQYKAPTDVIVSDLSDKVASHIMSLRQERFYAEHGMYYTEYRERFLKEFELSFDDFINSPFADISDETKKAIENFRYLVSKE